MRVVMFYHSLVSCWNHGNAHFLRGVAAELAALGHEVRVFEPAEGWSRANLLAEYGLAPLEDFRSAYPGLTSTVYDPDTIDLARVLDGAGLVLVHEWNDAQLVARIGAHHAARGGYVLLFHDTHHRSVSDPGAMEAYDLEGYDGVVAFGNIIRDLYLDRGWARQAWTWHEAADTRVFKPLARETREPEGDLIWIGNWGDGERTAEIREFLIEPAKALGLKARVYGVRYPEDGRAALAAAGIEYGGWLPNYRAPEMFARYRTTVHIPRRYYSERLPGIPTIRIFEALACGIPLVSAPWEDTEHLFTPGEDFLLARDGSEMKRQLRRLLDDPSLGRKLAWRGEHTVHARHTCAHRVHELLSIYEDVNAAREVAA